MDDSWGCGVAASTYHETCLLFLYYLDCWAERRWHDSQNFQVNLQSRKANSLYKNKRKVFFKLYNSDNNIKSF